jgi:PhzF family phenazine biosynthesis protein
MGQRIVQVDAFTAEPFLGNPAAVCVLEGPREESWMAAVAREMNLAETAFLHPEGDGWRLRWFTPRVEVALCGHATLASAHVLWEDGHLPPDQTAHFHTLSGRLSALRGDAWIELDFPATNPTPEAPPEGLLDALGLDSAVATARSRFDWLVEVADEALVRSVAPDFARLRTVKSRGVIVTARANDSAYDFVSRFFAPAVGVDEDPVTGSAHCTLTPWWAARLERTEMVGYQASERGGTVRVALDGERVRLSGRAVTVMRGELVC